MEEPRVMTEPIRGFVVTKKNYAQWTFEMTAKVVGTFEGVNIQELIDDEEFEEFYKDYGIELGFMNDNLLGDIRRPDYPFMEFMNYDKAEELELQIIDYDDLDGLTEGSLHRLIAESLVDDAVKLI